QTGLMIPEVAILRDMAGDYVLLIDENNVVSRQGVSIGKISNHLAEVTDGLGEDDKVIVDGLLLSRPGNKVNPTLKTITEAMTRIDPSAVAEEASKISRAAFAGMIEERTGRKVELPARPTVETSEDAPNNETGS
ncbi:MAG: hypothetical protein MK085_08615, partial [Phycisphaerales bacterium]|nr:hypothetical protein [Phycisphaerales bacterium]